MSKPNENKFEEIPERGTPVFIHLGRSDSWEPYIVQGHTLMEGLDGSGYRIFVDVVEIRFDGEKSSNRRLLNDVRPFNKEQEEALRLAYQVNHDLTDEGLNFLFDLLGGKRPSRNTDAIKAEGIMEAHEHVMNSMEGDITASHAFVLGGFGRYATDLKRGN